MGPTTMFCTPQGSSIPINIKGSISRKYPDIKSASPSSHPSGDDSLSSSVESLSDWSQASSPVSCSSESDDDTWCEAWRRRHEGAYSETAYNSYLRKISPECLSNPKTVYPRKILETKQLQSQSLADKSQASSLDSTVSFSGIARSATLSKRLRSNVPKELRTRSKAKSLLASDPKSMLLSLENRNPFGRDVAMMDLCPTGKKAVLSPSSSLHINNALEVMAQGIGLVVALLTVLLGAAM